MKNRPKALEKWHEMMKTGDSSRLDDLLADEVVFHSPVVHTPQRGKKNHQNLFIRSIGCTRWRRF